MVSTPFRISAARWRQKFPKAPFLPMPPLGRMLIRAVLGAACCSPSLRAQAGSRIVGSLELLGGPFLGREVAWESQLLLSLRWARATERSQRCLGSRSPVLWSFEARRFASCRVLQRSPGSQAMPSSSRQIRKAPSLRGLFSLLVENRDELHAERTGELNPRPLPNQDASERSRSSPCRRPLRRQRREGRLGCLGSGLAAWAGEGRLVDPGQTRRPHGWYLAQSSPAQAEQPGPRPLRYHGGSGGRRPHGPSPTNLAKTPP